MSDADEGEVDEMPPLVGEDEALSHVDEHDHADAEVPDTEVAPSSTSPWDALSYPHQCRNKSCTWETRS